MTENLVRINPRRTKTIKIPIYNPTNKDIKLQRKTIIGQLELISVAAPLEIKQGKLPEVNEIKICEDSPKWLPNVDLNHLPEDLRVRMQKLLTEQCDVLLKSDNEIGNIKSLKLKLNVTDPIPVCKPYCKIPTQIYSEVKEYIKDLMTNKWIKTSYSSSTSPMVCVQKRWNYEVVYRLQTAE